MQDNQTDISFIKDTYINIQKVIKIASKILRSTIDSKNEAQKQYPTGQKDFDSNYTMFNSLTEHFQILFKHELLLELDKIEVLIFELNRQLKKCPKKKNLILDIKSFLFGLNEKSYKYIINMFLGETEEIRNDIKVLSENWHKLFELNASDITHLKKTDFSNSTPLFYDFKSADIYYNLLSILLPVIQYLEEIEDVLSNQFINFLEIDLANKTQPKTFNYIQDVTSFLPVFLKEIRNVFMPITNKSFKSLYEITTERQHYIKCSFKPNTSLNDIIKDLPYLFDEEILLNIQNLDYDITKKEYYMNFLHNKLEEHFKDIHNLINENTDNRVLTESIKVILKQDFYDLEHTPFFRKIYTAKESINEEENPKEKYLYENIFDTFFSDWSSKFDLYLSVYNDIVEVYIKHVKPELLIAKQEELYEEQENPNNSRTLNSILILLDRIDFFNLPEVKNLGENKKGELLAFLTNYKVSNCKVTIKEMSESPSAKGRNNPYKSKKAKNDASTFLNKLNS